MHEPNARMSEDDHRFLGHAVALSRAHMLAGAGGPFGAVIVRGGRILAEGWNQVTSANDPTAHAEVVAIRRACTAVGAFNLADATLYTSCEPCPMCLAAAYWARISRIVFANTREDAARIGFDDAHIYEEIGRPLDARAVPIERLPSRDAADVFALWAAKTDKMPY